MKTFDDDDTAMLGVDTGSGRWFVIESRDLTWRLVAGPYQTEAAAERWCFEAYSPPDGVDTVAMVRCDGTWRDAIGHAQDAIARWNQMAVAILDQ